MDQAEVDEFNQRWKEEVDAFTNSTSEEKVDYFRRAYETEIGPLIEDKKYDQAALLLKGIVLVIAHSHPEIMLDVHCGFEYLTRADMLAKALRTKTNVETKLKEFKVYMAQTRLPKSRF